MEAPMCSLCEQRHYGACSAPVTPSEPRARKAAKGLRPTKKSTPALVFDGRSDEVKLEARVESSNLSGSTIFI